MESKEKTVLIYAIRRTEGWWKLVGENLGYDKSYITTDIKGVGDYCVVDDFYSSYKSLIKLEEPESDFFDRSEVADIIARCRLLRWLPVIKAKAMIHAMAIAFDKVLNETNPEVIVSFPIDRYVSDVLERLGKARGIPYYELTASLLPDMSMLMYRGELIQFEDNLSEKLLEDKVDEIASPLFTPTYVQGQKKFTKFKFHKTFWYFRLRGWVFKAISIIKNDPLNLHYLDSQAFLGHKPRLKDVKIVDMVDYSWKEKIESFDKSKRILFGLQLFPEASIDYWIDDLRVIQHEDMLVDAAKAFSDAGFQILVKDHPLQFGFRQTELLDRLLEIPNVLLIPYEVSGNELLSAVGTNFTCTGTLGLQAALLGLNSVVTKNYYTTEEDFICFETREEIKELPQRVIDRSVSESLEARQRRIISNVMKGSFESDFFSFEAFDAENPKPTVVELGEKFAVALAKLTKV